MMTDQATSTPPAFTIKQFTGDIWTLWERGWYVTVPTNLYVKADGEAVMGRGIALQATQRFERCALWYGFHLKEHVRKTPDGRNPRLEDINPYGLISVHPEWRAIFFPVKTSWNQGARKTLIQGSLNCLRDLMNGKHWPDDRWVAFPRVGCGNGMLDWDTEVKPMVRDFLLSLNEDVRGRVCIVHPTDDLVEPPPNWS